MTFNGSVFNGAAFNGSASQPVQPQNPTGNTVLTLQQIVGYAHGETVLTVSQSVSASGDTALTIDQNVYSIDDLSFTNWDVAVFVNGTDISADLTGEISIDAERNAARLAQFTVMLSGAVAPTAWLGKSVAIDFTQSNGAVWRRFTGVIVEPSINITDMTLTCRCSDDLQRIVDGYTNDQLLSATGGYWSKAIFSDESTGYDYLQDVLSTVSKSFERDAAGHLAAHSWQAKPVADYVFGPDLIDDGSLSVEIGRRANLINTVNVILDSRFERLYHRQVRFYWTTYQTVSFCTNYFDPFLWPVRSMVSDAVDSAGWTLLAAQYMPLWPTGGYNCSGNTVGWINVDPDQTIRAFDIQAAYRWRQSVVDRFVITVKDVGSVAAHGELATSLQGAFESLATVADWDKEGAADTEVPAGFSTDDQHNRYRDEIDAAGLENALQTVTAVAAETIAKSHRSNKAIWSMALAPYLELRHTIRIDDDDVQAKGVISRIQERYVFDSGEATSVVEMTLSAGFSGSSQVGNALSLPSHPDLPLPVGVQEMVVVPMHVGGKAASPALTEDDWGVLTNYVLQDVGAEVYPREMRLRFDGVDDAKTQNQTIEVTHDISIATPQDLLTITA